MPSLPFPAPDFAASQRLAGTITSENGAHFALQQTAHLVPIGSYRPIDPQNVGLLLENAPHPVNRHNTFTISVWIGKIVSAHFCGKAGGKFFSQSKFPNGKGHKSLTTLAPVFCQDFVRGFILFFFGASPCQTYQQSCLICSMNNPLSTALVAQTRGAVRSN